MTELQLFAGLHTLQAGRNLFWSLSIEEYLYLYGDLNVQACFLVDNSNEKGPGTKWGFFLGLILLQFNLNQW